MFLLKRIINEDCNELSIFVQRAEQTSAACSRIISSLMVLWFPDFKISSHNHIFPHLKVANLRDDQAVYKIEKAPIYQEFYILHINFIILHGTQAKQLFCQLQSSFYALKRTTIYGEQVLYFMLRTMTFMVDSNNKISTVIFMKEKLCKVRLLL